MATRNIKSPKATRTVEALKHDEATRKNIPAAEYQYPVRVAYERRNRDLDPQLVWRGKDQQDWSDLVVQAPPLYIQEKVHPKALVDDLLRESREREHEAGQITADLFADFNGHPARRTRRRQLRELQARSQQDEAARAEVNLQHERQPAIRPSLQAARAAYEPSAKPS